MKGVVKSVITNEDFQLWTLPIVLMLLATLVIGVHSIW